MQANSRKKTAKLTNEVSTRTIRHCLLENGLRRCIARKKPLVSKKCKAPYSICKGAYRKILRFFETNPVGNESKFNMFGSDGKQFVRRPLNKELHPRYTLKTLKHGEGSIIILAAFSTIGRLTTPSIR